MSSDNPSIIASNIISDVEESLHSPNISASVYLPWISYAYQKTYQALANSDQKVKEELFGNLTNFNLTPGTERYTLSGNMPRFGGIIKVEVKYGKTGDDWVRAQRLESVAHWKIQENVSTSYRSKANPLYYLLENNIYFIPTPPSDELDQTPKARVWYVRRPYQITLSTDVIDIDYRFIYPIVNYVKAKAIQRENEDYETAERLERQFERDLEMVAQAAVSEHSENEGTNAVQVDASDDIFSNPFDY